MTCLAAPTVPGLVRTLVQFRLAEWGLGGAPDLCLVAGELVANAIEATPYRDIRVRFVREPGSVLLGVWDSSDRLPVSAPIAELTLDDVVPDAAALDAGHDDGTGGWGLPLVQALSSECGVCSTRPPGKWVWARFGSWPPAEGQPARP